MNAGVNGMADGRDGGRKVIAQTGRTTGTAGDPWSANAFGLSEYSNAVAHAAGVRTEIYSAQGKGAARFFSVYLAVLASTNTIEVEVDGVVIVSNSLPSSVAGSRAVVGTQVSAGGAAASMALDYIPFNASFKVFVTSSVLRAIGGVRWSYLMEAHQ